LDIIYLWDAAMVTDLRIPEGIVVRTAKGGPDSLKGILSDLKQYSFTGYIRVTLAKEIMSSMGYLVVEQGNPIMAVYEFEKSKPRELRRIYTGEKSLRFILEDSQDKGSNIEIHSRVASEEFERRFPDAKISESPLPITVKPAKEMPEEEAPAEREEAPEDEEEESVDGQKEIIEVWRRKGFKVDSLEAALRRGGSALTKELSSFEQDAQKLKQFEVILNNFPVIGHEKDIEEIRAKLDDRTKIAEVESDIEFLQEKIKRKIQKRKTEEESIKQEMEKKKREEKAADVYDLILRYQTAPEETVEKKCPRCGGPVDPNGRCPKCSAEAAEAPATPAFMKQLPEGMRFDNFVIGPGSKFPVAAAVAVADAPSRAYNPLLIFGGSGLGKTHLLSAIGNQIKGRMKNAKLAYVPADRFVEAFGQSQDEHLRLKMREDLKRSDVLFVDDMQFLAASDAAQQEMAQVIDYLIDSKKQVVLASDRLPAQIPGFSDRLSSRIMLGLTTDLQPPDIDTRVKILKVKAEEKGLKLSTEIIEYIADRVTTNVRELESALTKIAAFSSIMKLDIDLNLVSDILKPLAPVQETRKEIMKEVKAVPGHCYLVEEERPMYSNVLLSRKMDEGFAGLVITRMNPKRIRDEFKVAPEILWLTDKESTQEKTIPPSLEMLVHTVQTFMAAEEKGMVVLDGIQYLVSNTSFEAVLRLLRSLIDEMSESNCILAISVSPETMKPQEVSILEREMEVLNLT
jgi:chromosomal replication initiator protein DnaA